MKFDFNFTELSSRKQIVSVLAILTGVLHLLYGLTGVYPRLNLGMLDYLFIANFVGNLAFISALYFMPELDKYQEYIRYGFILFTMSSIIAYIITYAPGGLSTLLLPAGVFGKLLEVTLIIFLLMDRPLDEHHHHKTHHTHNQSTA